MQGITGAARTMCRLGFVAKTPIKPLLLGFALVGVPVILTRIFDVKPDVMLGFAACVLMLVFLPMLFLNIAAEEKKAWVRLRAEGKPATAVVKAYQSLRGHYDQCGVLLELDLPEGKVGKQLAAAIGGGVTFDYLADVCATGRPVEVLYMPDSRKVVLKDPRTGKFE